MVDDSWISEPRHLPQWETTLHGSGVSTKFFTAETKNDKRADYYLLPHRAIRDLIGSMTLTGLHELFYNHQMVQSVLQKAFAMLEVEVKQFGGRVTLGPEMLSFDRFIINIKSPVRNDSSAGNIPLLLISMPQPENAAEVYFVGICFNEKLDQMEEDRLKSQLIYLTLEAAMPNVSLSRTVMGRWMWNEKEGSYNHITYGGGTPSSDPYMFVEYCERIACILTK